MTQEQDRPVRRLLVWDLPLRLFHWGLLVCVAGAVISVNLADSFADGMLWHARFGFAVLALLLFRIIWGFVGGTHARFGSFICGPAAVLAYIRTLKGPYTPSVGHNPLGALSVLALLASVLFQAVSGLFLNDEDFFLEGPLYRYVSGSVSHLLRECHEANAGLLMVLIGLHIAAIFFYLLVKKEDLIHPMITGWKQVPQETTLTDARGGHPLLGLVLFALVAAGVCLLVLKP